MFKAHGKLTAIEVKNKFTEAILIAGAEGRLIPGRLSIPSDEGGFVGCALGQGFYALFGEVNADVGFTAMERTSIAFVNNELLVADLKTNNYTRKYPGKIPEPVIKEIVRVVEEIPCEE